MATTALGTARRRVDLGRLVMVPFGAAQVAICMGHAVMVASSDHPSVPDVVGSVLTGLFYAMLIAAYLRRSRAVATSRSLTSHMAALVATWLPFLLPTIPAHRPATAVVVAGDALLIAGMAWSAWCVSTLGRSFSILAQARRVVSTGPYRLVRHPLYLGEITSTLGVTLVRGVVWGGVTVAVLAALQLYRAHHEEAILGASLDGYRDYCARTKRIVPWIY